VEIARSKNHLVMVSPGNGGIELHPTSETDFFLITGNDEYVFRLDSAGRAQGFTQDGDGRTGPAPGVFAPFIRDARERAAAN
jgi:hypothetical protein